MTLTAPTNEQLNEAFAEKVAGWKRVRTIGFVMDAWRDENDVFQMRTKPWCESADEVLPWLEKWPMANAQLAPGMKVKWLVEILLEAGKGDESKHATGHDESLPRACVIALLRAHGVTVEL